MLEQCTVDTEMIIEDNLSNRGEKNVIIERREAETGRDREDVYELEPKCENVNELTEPSPRRQEAPSLRLSPTINEERE